MPRATRATPARRIYDAEVTRQREAFDKIYKMDGPENIFSLWRELGDWMTENVTVVRFNAKLKATDNRIMELKDRWGRVGLNDRGKWADQELLFVRHLYNMLELARPITLGALNRNESRGAITSLIFPSATTKTGSRARSPIGPPTARASATNRWTLD